MDTPGPLPVLVIGAGPAGLTAAVRLRQADVPVPVVEAGNSVGGISRTVERDGWRTGMHRYNNQDHSMLTAMLSADNIVSGTSHDVWTVNVEEDYHETVSDHGAVYPTGTAATRTGRDAPILPRREREPVRDREESAA